MRASEVNATCDARRPEISESLALLDKAIDRCNVVRNNLAERLERVLRPVEPVPEGVNKRESYRAPLANELQSMTAQLEEITNQYEDLLGRIEI